MAGAARWGLKHCQSFIVYASYLGLNGRGGPLGFETGMANHYNLFYL